MFPKGAEGECYMGFDLSLERNSFYNCLELLVVRFL